MKKIFFFFVTLISLFSCNTDNCSKNLGFNLDYHLFDDIKVNGNTYCQLVNKALRGNKQAIIDLSKIEVGDGASYQHGAVLIEVIDKISEKEYLNTISSLSNKEKKTIYYSFIEAGLEYTSNEKYRKKNIEIAFPKLSKVIKCESVGEIGRFDFSR